jgi:GT2 family glycosyltransferase
MNVLIIVPEKQFKEKYEQEWRTILSPKDKLFFLSLKKGQNFCSDLDIMTIDYHFSENERFLINFLMKFSSWNGLLHKIWVHLVINQLYEFIFCIRSFDPDIVDFRSLRLEEELVENFSKELYPIKTIFKKIDSLEKNFSHWRFYNPETLVSIILPVHNGEKYIQKSIESCLNQTHKNFELIIVDDCSTDSTSKILQEFAQRDSRIKLYRNSSNLRLPATLNVGFSHSSGEMLTWTSDDNYFDPNALKYLVSYLNTWNSIDFVYSAYMIIDEQGNQEKWINYLPPPWNLPRENTVGAYFLYLRSVYESVGDFDSEMEYLEDYDYWVRVYLKKFRMMRLHIPLYYYRHHSESLTVEAKQKNEKIWDKVKLKYFNK